MATFKERRKVDRLRNQRFRERLKSEGGKVQNLYLTFEVVTRLNELKQQTSKTFTDIISDALMSHSADTDLRSEVN